MKPLKLIIVVAVVAIVAASSAARAQISPECAGVQRPADYNENLQQAYLQNYFAAGFLLTPLFAPVPQPGTAQAVIELGVIPPVSCEHRLVLDGTKTEDTNKSPLLPRPRLRFALPNLGPIATFGGLALLPPLPSPVGTLLIVGTELGAGARLFDEQLLVGVRGHLSFSRMRGEIASPFVAGDPAVDDLFFTSGLGLDVDVGWALMPTSWVRLVPWVGVGIADVSTFFVVGDDGVIVQNVEAPWSGALVMGGLQAHLFEHIVATAEFSAAVPIYPTIKLGVGVSW